MEYIVRHKTEKGDKNAKLTSSRRLRRSAKNLQKVDDKESIFAPKKYRGNCGWWD